MHQYRENLFRPPLGPMSFVDTILKLAMINKTTTGPPIRLRRSDSCRFGWWHQLVLSRRDAVEWETRLHFIHD